MQSSQYIELFYVDAIKNQIEINELFSLLEKEYENKDIVDALFINFHILKGHALGLGFKAIESMAHVLEEVFEGIREAKLELNHAISKEIKSAIHALGKLIESLKSEEKVKYLVQKARLGAILSELRIIN